MSGVEILGIAAAVLQIADLGAKVSVKLFGFARKVRGAAEKIDMISKEIAATGALLQQLSAQLDKDSQAQLLRRELIESADDIVRSCKEIFKNIDKAIDGNSGSKIILGFKQRIHYTYLESEIDALRTNLESLKGSISIMQNVLIYAEQLRNRERFPVLKEQQDLLKALGEEKLANERRYDELMRAIEKRGSQSQMSTFSSLGQPDASFFAAHVALGPRSQNLEAVEYPHTPSSSSNNRIVFDEGKLRDYISLVACIIEDIHSKRYKLDKGMRLRVQDGVLDLHWQEWAAYRQYYSDDVLLRKFRQLPELVHFWVRKIEEEGRTDHVSAGRASSTSDLPQPNIIINADVGIRGRGRGRVRARSRSRGRRYHDDDIVEEIIERRGREGFRTPSPYHRYDYETQQALERLKVYEQETAEAQEVQKKYKADLDLKKAKEQLMKAEAEEKRKIKYKDAEIAEIMERRLRLEAAAASSLDDLTYTRLPRKYVSFQTLNVFDLDWELDEENPNYVIIKQAVSPTLKNELYENTAKRQAGWVRPSTATRPALPSTDDTRHQRRHSFAVGLQSLTPPRCEERFHTEPELPTRHYKRRTEQRPAPWSRSPSPTPPPKDLDINALVSQWTTLSQREIAQGDAAPLYGEMAWRDDE